MPGSRRISPKKLLHTKWTACRPAAREKHFLVVDVERADTDPQRVLKVTLEAVLTRRRRTLDWRDLNDTEQWIAGWQ